MDKWTTATDPPCRIMFRKKRALLTPFSVT